MLPAPRPGRKGELQTRILAYLGELDPSSQAATAALGRSVPRAPRDQWRMEQAGAHAPAGMPPTPTGDPACRSGWGLSMAAGPRSGVAARATVS